MPNEPTQKGKKFELLISPKWGKRKTTKLIVLKLHFLFEGPALKNVRAATTKGLCLLFSSKFQLLLFYCDWAESQDHRILTPFVSMCLVLRVGGSFKNKDTAVSVCPFLWLLASRTFPHLIMYCNLFSRWELMTWNLEFTNSDFWRIHLMEKGLGRYWYIVFRVRSWDVTETVRDSHASLIR